RASGGTQRNGLVRAAKTAHPLPATRYDPVRRSSRPAPVLARAPAGAFFGCAGFFGVFVGFLAPFFCAAVGLYLDPALLERFLESAHQVDALAALDLGGSLGDFLAAGFLAGRLDDSFTIAVLVLVDVELFLGQITDEPLGQLYLGRFRRRVRSMIDFAKATHLVAVVHGVEHETILVVADKDDVFFSAHGESRHRHLPGLIHGFGEQTIGARRGWFASEQKRALEKYRVDFIDRNEFADLDRVITARLEVL